MTLSPLTVYFVLQADAISGAACWLFGLLTFFTAIWAAVPRCALADMSESDKDYKKFWESALAKSPSFITPIVCLLLFFGSYSLIPSTKTLAAIIIAPAIVNSSVVQQDIPELYSLGIEKLKESLKEAK